MIDQENVFRCPSLIRVNVQYVISVCLFHLMNYINPVVELLPLQKRVHVVEQELKVKLSVSVGNDDGRPMPRLTVRWPVASSKQHQWIFTLNIR